MQETAESPKSKKRPQLDGSLSLPASPTFSPQETQAESKRFKSKSPELAPGSTTSSPNANTRSHGEMPIKVASPASTHLVPKSLGEHFIEPTVTPTHTSPMGYAHSTHITTPNSAKGENASQSVENPSTPCPPPKNSAPLFSFGFSSFAKSTATFASFQNQPSIFAQSPRLFASNPQGAKNQKEKADNEAEIDSEDVEDDVSDAEQQENDDTSSQHGLKSRITAEIVVAPTGEEQELVMHSVRAKLYIDEKTTYKERGIGTLKINLNCENGNRARLVMRSDHTYKVLLNCHLVPGMRCVVTDNFVRFVAIEDAQFITYLFKVANAKAAEELAQEILKFTAVESSPEPSHDNDEEA